MIRAPFFALLAAGVVSASVSRADVEVAPPPREIRPDGSRDPAPQPVAAKKENPLEVVDRIIQNSKAVGDKLAMTDTGTDTRKTQDKILKDIDALLDQDDPPPKSDSSQDKNDKKDHADKKTEPKDTKNDPMGNMNDMPPPMPKDGMGGMGQEPKGGDQPKSRKPRQNGEQAKEKDTDMGLGGTSPKKEPNEQPKQPSKSAGGGQLPNPKGGSKSPPGKPLFPNEEDVMKDVWGHLPDQLRQQATQYYKQEFMPRYAELLKQYYTPMTGKK